MSPPTNRSTLAQAARKRMRRGSKELAESREERERGYEDVQECLKVLPGIAAARRVREAEDLEGRVKVLCSLR
jgi:hypothetical protein